MPLEEVPCSSPRPNSQRAHNTVCSFENYVLNVHRFLGPNFASVRAAAFCGWIASDDAHRPRRLPVTPASSDSSDRVEASRLALYRRVPAPFSAFGIPVAIMASLHNVV
jgi:hypothetical protein